MSHINFDQLLARHGLSGTRLEELMTYKGYPPQVIDAAKQICRSQYAVPESELDTFVFSQTALLNNLMTAYREEIRK
jgi:hypothetical protein